MNTECNHEWEESELERDWDSTAPGYTPVRCKNCDMPGERDNTDNSVFWPTT